jgi:hypothetical protein
MRVEIQREEMGLPYAQLTELTDHGGRVRSHLTLPLGWIAPIATKSRNRNDRLERRVTGRV